jgi:hypothetical protein
MEKKLLLERDSFLKPVDECNTFFDLVASAYVATHPGVCDIDGFEAVLKAQCDRFALMPEDVIQPSASVV